MIKSESILDNSFEKPDPQFTKAEKEIILATVIILLLNIIDGVLTIWGIHRHLIEEGNPLMHVLIAKNAIAFIFTIKILLAIILGAACWRIRNASHKLASYSLRSILIVYMFIMMVHFHWIYILLIL